MLEYPLIFDIRRCSMDDGPGIRTVVFFKGCPLKCVWCHNPESMSPSPQIAFYPDKCISCKECEKACFSGAINKDSGNGVDITKCTACGRCEYVCPALAIKKVGKRYSINELLKLVLVDEAFYKISGGGVTLSGGEPTFYMDYAGEFLRKLKKNGIHTAIQTCGFFDFSEFYKKIYPSIDLIFYDIKIIDREVHNNYTGTDNKVILENLAQLIRLKYKNVIARTPLIPGITDTNENLSAIKKLVDKLNLEHQVLEYNPIR